ncbi:raffinose/stachyose/melibiose transport system substrate-binding protein [Actinoplanes lutulentus]|uniref:Carbohydrate ABC transporter substrate-binding protein (CUT1 family) n=1 Tax=Actinoplanes lutulentus TaxID=1287878 RepID=A0A327ZL74_9ACTN|nr:extracellular solute-binding protein [Actinoplanes lutulentus]MBB2940734.1 raffinose/stachyose/melibiose transport system substrate-binding protein [Actinoplanes lutulentus]RAK43045.1 carbohydrate ABC transporter substrate-binding protein (CUT1 family) [Actinoplanes lutulentus]
MASHFKPKHLMAAAGAVALVLSTAACGGSSDSGSTTAKNFSFLAINENTTIAKTLTTLSQKECATQNTAQPLEIKNQAQASLDQQLQLLAGQGALPQLFTAANAPSLTSQLADNGTVLDAAAVSESVLPAASSTIKSLYDGKQLVLPTELNIEGIWYNKKLLTDNGITTVPSTWEDLVAAFAKLQGAGVQPISQAGKGGDGWGVTRWVGNYILRQQGPDALKKVADGSAKLTDPQYVAAADAIAALGKAGYFGKSPTSIDYATALNTFLTGKAAFIYMGSWALSDFNDETKNKIGVDNVGFLKFPTVAGGVGTADQMPANVGTAVAISKKAYEGDANTQAWVKCIVDNYGTVALRDSSQITGFTTDSAVEVPALTKEIQTEIGNVQSSVLWFEGYFSAKATTVSQSNGGLLGSGQLTGEKFMQTVTANLG